MNEEGWGEHGLAASGIAHTEASRAEVWEVFQTCSTEVLSVQPNGQRASEHGST